jgi:hypothetical protein
MTTNRPQKKRSAKDAGLRQHRPRMVPVDPSVLAAVIGDGRTGERFAIDRQARKTGETVSVRQVF